MGRQVPISKVASVMLSVSGYGYTFITVPNGTRWSVSLVSVSTNAPVPVPGTTAAVTQPVISLYRDNKPNQAAFVEGSYSGNRTSSNSVHELNGGDSLCVEWQGTAIDAGHIGTMRVAGLQTEN